MRFRKLAGTTAGALVLGALSVPMTMTAAQAAPVVAQTPFSAVCTYSTFSLPVAGNLKVTVDSKAVKAELDATANMGVSSPSLKTTKLGMQLTVDIDGEATLVKGETTFTPPKASDASMAIPTMTGTRASRVYPSKFDVTKGQLDLTITYGAGVANCVIVDIAPVSFPVKPKACADAEGAFATAQSNSTAAAAAAGAAAPVAQAASAKATSATKSASNAAKSVTKASKAVKKASKAVKKAKSKAAKAKAKKAQSKAKKAQSKAKKAQSKAKSQLTAARAALATANANAAAANGKAASAASALAIADTAFVQAC